MLNKNTQCKECLMYIIQSIQPEQIALQTDEEFLQTEINHLGNIFRGEMISIKNTSLEYIAFSEEYATEFNLDDSALGTNKAMSDQVDIKIQSEIINQEHRIIKELSLQDSTYFYKKNNKTTFCAMRKRRLINPTTQRVVGLFIVASKIDPGIIRKHIVRQLLPWNSKNIAQINTNLTKQQQQIAFCLLLGFHSRREIADILSQLNKSDFNETSVKNGLQALYQKFECNTTSSLLKLIVDSSSMIEISVDFIPEGSYPDE